MFEPIKMTDSPVVTSATWTKGSSPNVMIDGGLDAFVGINPDGLGTGKKKNRRRKRQNKRQRLRHHKWVLQQQSAQSVLADPAETGGGAQVIRKKTAAYGGALEMAAGEGNVEIIRVLLENGASPNYLALHAGIRSGHQEIVQMFVDKGSDVSACEGGQQRSQYGRNALHLGAIYGDVEIVKAILASPNTIEIDSADSGGLTALAHACKEGHNEVVQTLVEAKASVSVVDTNGLKALNHSAKQGSVFIVEALLKAGAEPDAEALRTAIKAGKFAAAQALRIAGAELPDDEKRDENGTMTTGENEMLMSDSKQAETPAITLPANLKSPDGRAFSGLSIEDIDEDGMDQEQLRATIKALKAKLTPASSEAAPPRPRNTSVNPAPLPTPEAQAAAKARGLDASAAAFKQPTRVKKNVAQPKRPETPVDAGKKFVPQEFCICCKKPGHKARYCKSQRAKCWNCCMERGHPLHKVDAQGKCLAPKDGSQALCFECLQQGHKKENCPSKKCYLCLKPGHVWKKCEFKNSTCPKCNNLFKSEHHMRVCLKKQWEEREQKEHSAKRNTSGDKSDTVVPNLKPPKIQSFMNGRAERWRHGNRMGRGYHRQNWAQGVNHPMGPGGWRGPPDYGYGPPEPHWGGHPGGAHPGGGHPAYPEDSWEPDTGYGGPEHSPMMSGLNGMAELPPFDIEAERDWGPPGPGGNPEGGPIEDQIAALDRHKEQLQMKLKSGGHPEGDPNGQPGQKAVPWQE